MKYLIIVIATVAATIGTVAAVGSAEDKAIAEKCVNVGKVILDDKVFVCAMQMPAITLPVSDAK